MSALPQEVQPLAWAESFRFRCHPGVNCFTECCRELELALSPYDVLGLRQYLGLSARDFLHQYAVIEFTPEDLTPQVYLAMIDDGRASCPFVTARGCQVYPHRPAACRAYPLGRGLSPALEGGAKEHFVLVREGHCQGFAESTGQTVEAWQEDQGLAHHNRMAERLLALQPREGGRLRRLTETEGEDYLDLLYRLERSRLAALLGGRSLPESETELLSLAMDWLQAQWQNPR